MISRKIATDGSDLDESTKVANVHAVFAIDLCEPDIQLPLDVE